MDEVVTRALDGQKRRAIGTIMAAVDSADLFNDDFARIRKAVLDAINDLHRNNLEIVDGIASRRNGCS
jgi:hypothetical protein